MKPSAKREYERAKPSPGRRSFSINEICERNKVSRRFVYDEINRGRLKVKKAGRRSLITDEAEGDWLDSLPEYQPAV